VAREVTLLTIRDLAKLYADERSSGVNAFIKDLQLNKLVNLALAELYDDLVNARGAEYYELEDTSIVTVSGTASYDLPSDYYRLLSLHLQWGTDELEEMHKLGSLNDRHLYTRISWQRWTRKAYHEHGKTLEFFPTPTGPATVVLRYVPAFQDLTTDASTFDGVNGWERVVALRVAVEIRMIQKLPYGDLMSLYQQERDRIQALAADRVVGEPAKIRDVDPEGGGRGDFGPWGCW